MRISDTLKSFCVKAENPRALETVLEILEKRGYLVISDNMSQYPDINHDAFKEIQADLMKIAPLKFWEAKNGKYYCCKFVKEDK